MFILKCTGIGIESDWYRYWYWKALVLVLLLVLERYWYWKSVGERAGYGWVAPILAKVSHLWWLWGGGGPSTSEQSTILCSMECGEGADSPLAPIATLLYTLQYICKIETTEKPVYLPELYSTESDILERFCQENFTQPLQKWWSNESLINKPIS